MNLIPKKLQPSDLKEGGRYYKTMKSGNIKTREIKEFYVEKYYSKEFQNCVCFTEKGKMRTWCWGEPIEEDFHCSVVQFCRWAEGVVEWNG